MRNNQEPLIWKWPATYVALVGGTILLLIWAFSGGLLELERIWGSSEEYGYGYMIPVIAVFFIWQRQNELAILKFTGSWLGVLALLLGGFLFILGELATLFIVVQYAFLVSLYGLALSIMGWKGFRIILPALILLVFMIPLPGFLYENLSAELQLISSKLGVEVIRLFGISVYLEGNVIDLGSYQLQVVEACSGLRYLFPLAALSYMAAYMFKGAFWKKAVIFISSAPITVLMNSFRIGVIGVLVEYWGIEQAEGFLHDFEGWIVFMACMAVLVLVMWMLSKVGKDKAAFADVFELTLPEPLKGERKDRGMTSSFKAMMPLVLVLAILPMILEQREEIIPQRQAFQKFPMVVHEWNGRNETMEQKYIDVLQFDDYIMSNFTNDTGEAVSLYAAYYESQRKGASIHSPRSCIPGGGWQIKQHVVKDLKLGNSNKLAVNRLLIQKGSNRQLVYYWFDQRGRNMTNEYVIKWYLFWDALTKNRTDGALVRVTTFVPPEVDLGLADETLERFVNDTHHIIKKYIPD